MRWRSSGACFKTLVSVAATLSLIAGLFVSGIAGAGIARASAPAEGETDWWQGLPLRLASCRAQVTIDPTYGRFDVTCTMEFEVTGDPTERAADFGAFYTFRVPSGFGAVDVGTMTGGSRQDLDYPDPVLSRAPDTVYFPQAWSLDGQGSRVAQVSEIGSTRRIVLAYRGAPYQTPGAHVSHTSVWVTAPRLWLPYQGGKPIDDDAWAGVSFDLEATVPGASTVLVPGRAVTSVDKAGGGGTTAVFHFDEAGAAAATCWAAGPYSSEGRQATERGGSYQVWRLPGSTLNIAGDLEGFVDYLAADLGVGLGTTVTVIEVSPGLGEPWPVRGTGTVLVPAGTDPTAGGAAWQEIRVACLRETLLALAPYFDGGLAEDVALGFLRQSNAEWVATLVEGKRNRLLEGLLYRIRNTRGSGGIDMVDVAVASFATTGFGTTRGGFGPGTGERQLFLYDKSALIWETFRFLYGEEIMDSLLHRLVAEGAGRDPRDVAGWFQLVRKSLGEVAGESGTRFYDWWIGARHPYDLALKGVRAEESPDGTWVLRATVAKSRFTGSEDTPSLTADGSVPWVDLAVSCEGAPPVTVRVTLPGPGETPEAQVDEVPVEVLCPGRPTQVALDPEGWILDYNPSNNVVIVETTGAKVLRYGLRALGWVALVAALCGVWYWLRARKGVY